MLGALLTAAAAGGFTPPRLFGDWYAGCDNGHYCTAVALLPESSYSQPQPKWFTMAIERSPGGAAPRLSINAINPEEPDNVPDYRLSLLVDGKPSGVRFDDKGNGGAVPAGILQAIAKARALTLANSRGDIIGHISVAGAARALAWVEQLQARSATKLPRIVTPARSSAPAVRPSASAIRQIMKANDCPGYDEKPQFVRLDAATSLALLPCSDEGDGTSSVAVLVSNQGKVRTPQFDHAYAREGRVDTANILSIAGFDRESFSLQEFDGGPAMGDCGGARAWVWDGARFRLANQVIMEQCRGSYAMVPVWRTANVPEIEQSQ